MADVEEPVFGVWSSLFGAGVPSRHLPWWQRFSGFQASLRDAMAGRGYPALKRRAIFTTGANALRLLRHTRRVYDIPEAQEEATSRIFEMWL